MKTKLSQGLLPDMELLEKVFPTILGMENTNKEQNLFFGNCTKNESGLFLPLFACSTHTQCLF